MRQELWTMNRSQKGFTLIEVLAAIAITGLIGAGITMAAVQVMNVNALSVNHIIAIKQVESAVYRINRDVRMAQIIQPSGNSGFPLNLSWVEWDNTDNTVHSANYSLENGNLRRTYSDGSQILDTVVAEHINSDPGSTSCNYSNGMFTLRVTASVSGFRPASETRMAQVIARPAP